jgi:hypothetical protein
MRWAILSDVHGNLEAFQAVIEDLRAEKADQIAFLGDVVGYGADPIECLSLLRDLTDWVIAGNHVTARGADRHRRVQPQRPLGHPLDPRQALRRESGLYPAAPPFPENGSATFVHATPNQPEEW